MTMTTSINKEEKILNGQSRTLSSSSSSSDNDEQEVESVREEENNTFNISPTPIAISMSGCGFLCSYHIGAMTCFQRHAKTLLSNVTMFCGASAGALIASLMVLAPDSLEDGLNRIYELSAEIPKIPYANYPNPLDKKFNMAQRLADLVDKHIPSDVAQANGRLVVSLTRKKDNSNRLVSKFPHRDYLMNCLNATCYIPHYSKGDPPLIDGEAYIDGAYSNNLPMISGMHTITISPFSGSAKIAPRKSNARFNIDFGRQITIGQQQFNISSDNILRIVQALFPNNDTMIKHYYEQGYRDAMNFLLKRGFYERPAGTEI